MSSGPTTGCQLLVMAKAPVPGRVKTRLCPPCTPVQAARLAAASLADTLDSAGSTPAVAHTLVLSGRYAAPAGWRVVPQREGPLGVRLAHAYRDTALPGAPSLLVGMDTPQLTPALLAASIRLLATPGIDAVLGPAVDGGWWALGLRDPGHGAALSGVPMSTDHTGADTLDALRARGLRVALLPELRDVDTGADAGAVAARCPRRSRFRRAAAAVLPAAAGHAPPEAHTTAQPTPPEPPTPPGGQPAAVQRPAGGPADQPTSPPARQPTTARHPTGLPGRRSSQPAGYQARQPGARPEPAAVPAAGAAGGPR